MCGEKLEPGAGRLWPGGSPPRMRGKVGVVKVLSELPRITPAYAGKSELATYRFVADWDHPRVCGEKGMQQALRCTLMGSPPRMRGKAGFLPASSFLTGITPAYAGKRGNSGAAAACRRDHPRMCGEKTNMPELKGMSVGSPPHVRGKVACANSILACNRITPACAGKRALIRRSSYFGRDHPRMCGEKAFRCGRYRCRVGSPPHVRGKGAVRAAGLDDLRITPACAGKRLKRSRSTVPPVAIVPLFPSVCNKPVVSDGSPAGRDAPLFLPAENAVPASPAYNLRSL